MGTEADEARKRRPSRSMVSGGSVVDIAEAEYSKGLATTVAVYFIDNGSWEEALESTVSVLLPALVPVPNGTLV
jgi:hypothetical protein